MGRGAVKAYETESPDDAIGLLDVDPACIRATLRRSGAAVKIEIVLQRLDTSERKPRPEVDGILALGMRIREAERVRAI